METSNEHLQQATKALRRGGVIAFPTETSYGLGCDPRDARAVRRIFKIKGRDARNPLLLVAGSWAQVDRVAHLSARVKRLAKQHWPGPLTLILPLRKEAGLAEGVAYKGEVSVRYSSSTAVRRLTRRFGFPIVATSANISGQPACRSAREIRSVNLEADFIVDGGLLPLRKPSTVARVHENGVIEVIRAGAVSLKASR